MARVKYTVVIRSPVTPESVPRGKPTPIKRSRSYARIDEVCARELQNDAAELIVVPSEYERGREFEYSEYEDTALEDGSWRESDARVRCWKATIIYSKVPPHSRLARFIRMDEWTGFPVLSKPTGPSLSDYLNTHYDALYDPRAGGTSGKTTALCRVNTRFLPLMYQWILQMANALKHVHACNAPPLHANFGTPKTSACFLTTPSLTLSIVGFLDASFNVGEWGNTRYQSQITTDHIFRPLAQHTTEQTDLFMFGCAIYELMTSVWPGDLQSLPSEQQMQLVASQAWPSLEGEYLGSIARKCWASEFTGAEQLMNSLQHTIVGLGWTLRGEDEIQDFDAAALFD